MSFSFWRVSRLWNTRALGTWAGCEGVGTGRRFACMRECARETGVLPIPWTRVGAIVSLSWLRSDPWLIRSSYAGVLFLRWERLVNRSSQAPHRIPPHADPQPRYGFPYIPPHRSLSPAQSKPQLANNLKTLAEGKERLEESLQELTDSTGTELGRRDQELATAKVRGRARAKPSSYFEVIT